jgi:putative endonuclease
MRAFVYMLRCADGSYYVGSATGDDLTKRIAEHQSGAFPGYPSTRRPVELVWSEHFERITDAYSEFRAVALRGSALCAERLRVTALTLDVLAIK